MLGIVPARAGSKGIANKNLVEVAGKPLLAWSIEAGLAAHAMTDVVVSSDSPEILEVAERYGATPVLRPAHLATDSSPSEPLVAHCLEILEESYDVVVLLQPTSPLRRAEDIDASVALLDNAEVNSVISVYEPHHTPFKAFKLGDDGYLTGLVDERSPFMRRQDLPSAFLPNGAIYVVRVEAFLRNKSFFDERCVPYLMKEELSVDIDTPADLELVTNILKDFL